MNAAYAINSIAAAAAVLAIDITDVTVVLGSFRLALFCFVRFDSFDFGMDVAFWCGAGCFVYAICTT